MEEQYSCRVAVRRVSMAAVQLWSRPKAAQQCCHHTSGGRRGGREKIAREGGDRLGFHRIFRCFGDAVLPHLCHINFALRAEDTGSQEFNFAPEWRPRR